MLATTGNTSTVADYTRVHENSRASIPEKLHNCQRSKKWFTWHVNSIIAKNELHSLHKTYLHTMKVNNTRPSQFCSFFFQLLRLRSIGKSGFRFWNPDFGFCNRTRNPKTDFTRNPSSGIFRISWISFLPFDWEIRKRICKTVLVNSALLFANYACACKTAVLKNSFSNPFADFPVER